RTFLQCTSRHLANPRSEAGRAVQLDSDYSGSVVVHPIFFVRFFSSENVCRRRVDRDTDFVYRHRRETGVGRT
ncbi:hypothetical protein C8R44DRAFT_980691, partial [Mycena epipterygia]